jgi:superfamily II DNA or RNA helicase
MRLRVVPLSATFTRLQWERIMLGYGLREDEYAVVKGDLDRPNVVIHVTRREGLLTARGAAAQRTYKELQFLVDTMRADGIALHEADDEKRMHFDYKTPKTIIMVPSQTAGDAVFAHLARSLAPEGRAMWDFGPPDELNRRFFGKIYSKRRAAYNEEQVRRFNLGLIRVLIVTSVAEHGVDFRSVLIAIAIGSSRTVAQFMQGPWGRVGRTGELCQVLCIVNGADMKSKVCEGELADFYKLGLPKKKGGAVEQDAACLRAFVLAVFGDKVKSSGVQNTCLCCGNCRRRCTTHPTGQCTDLPWGARAEQTYERAELNSDDEDVAALFDEADRDEL